MPSPAPHTPPKTPARHGQHLPSGLRPGWPTCCGLTRVPPGPCVEARSPSQCGHPGGPSSNMARVLVRRPGRRHAWRDGRVRTQGGRGEASGEASPADTAILGFRPPDRENKRLPVGSVPPPELMGTPPDSWGTWLPSPRLRPNRRSPTRTQGTPASQRTPEEPTAAGAPSAEVAGCGARGRGAPGTPTSSVLHAGSTGASVPAGSPDDVRKQSRQTRLCRPCSALNSEHFPQMTCQTQGPREPPSWGQKTVLEGAGGATVGGGMG